MTVLTYFAADGSYGGARDLVVIDTSDWTQDEWDVIDFTPDDDRSRVAFELAHGGDPDAQPELPGMADEN